MGHTKNHATSRVTQTVTQLLGTHKKMQLHRTTKKSGNLSGHKKIMQPLGTKNTTISFDKKNHAISEDKKKTSNLSGQKKSCNLLGQKNITQPLGTKRNALSRDKKDDTTSRKKNHTTFWDNKKIM